MSQILLGEETIEFTTRVSKRAKRISIRCHPDSSFEIVYPAGDCAIAPEEIFQMKRKWVLRKRQALRDGSKDAVVPRRYVDGAILPFLGEELQIRLVEMPDKRIIANRQETCLVVTLPRYAQNAEDAVKSAVIAFYRREAKTYLPQRTSQLASKFGFEYNRIRIKNQKTRWGSCSAKRNLNFNLRLMMAPADAIDSVIIHELCHLKFLNHSRHFWNLVAQCFPDYRHWQQWFKDNGRRLVF